MKTRRGIAVLRYRDRISIGIGAVGWAVSSYYGTRAIISKISGSTWWDDHTIVAFGGFFATLCVIGTLQLLFAAFKPLRRSWLTRARAIALLVLEILIIVVLGLSFLLGVYLVLMPVMRLIPGAHTMFVVNCLCILALPCLLVRYKSRR